MAERGSNNGPAEQAGGLLARAPERAILVGVDMPGAGWPVPAKSSVSAVTNLP